MFHHHPVESAGADPGPIADEYQEACAKGHHDELPEIAARLHTAERASGLAPGATLFRRRNVQLSMPRGESAAEVAEANAHRDQIMHNFIMGSL